MDRRPRYWFRRKRLGWGWEPGTREGWIVTLAFGLAFILEVNVFRVPLTLSIATAIGFLAVVVLRGEPLR